MKENTITNVSMIPLLLIMGRNTKNVAIILLMNGNTITNVSTIPLLLLMAGNTKKPNHNTYITYNGWK